MSHPIGLLDLVSLILVDSFLAFENRLIYTYSEMGHNYSLFLVEILSSVEKFTTEVQILV